jgi:threonine dehydrogenase-like Zn-dependent dehydrogenase
MGKMKAAVFVEKGRIEIQEKPIPEIGPTDALIKITTTTICGTDVHILKGEVPVQPGRTLGHEPVGVIAELGAGVHGYEIGQRILAGAITPCGQCNFCLDGYQAQCGGKPLGGWRFGNTIDGSQAEYMLVPNAIANLTPIPDELTDEQVLMCPDVMSTGFSGAESGNIKIGDTVAIFAQGPIGMSATVGARLRGASKIIAVSSNPARLKMSQMLGSDIVLNYKECNPVEAILDLTNGRGVDVAIEALGIQETFEACLRVVKPGGIVSSLGVYSGKLTIPVDAFAAGIGDKKIVTSLCPGGKERMRRLINIIQSARADLRPMITHRFKLDQIKEAYELFGNQRDGVIKVAINP